MEMASLTYCIIEDWIELNTENLLQNSFDFSNQGSFKSFFVSDFIFYSSNRNHIFSHYKRALLFVNEDSLLWWFIQNQFLTG